MCKPFDPLDQTDIQSMIQRLYGCVTLPLDRRCGTIFRVARPAGLGEANQPGFVPDLSIFGTCSLEIKTHPKLVELVRIKSNMNGT